MKYFILTMLMLFASAVEGGNTTIGGPCGREGQKQCIFGCHEGYNFERGEGEGRCGACGHRDQRCCDNREQCESGLSCEAGSCRRPPGEPEPSEPEPSEPDETDCLGARVWEVVISDPAGCVEAYLTPGDSYEEASQCLGVSAGWHVESEGTRYRLVNLCQNCVGDLYLPVAVTTQSEDDAVMCATSSLGNGCTYTLGECPEDPPDSPEPPES